MVVLPIVAVLQELLSISTKSSCKIALRKIHIVSILPIALNGIRAGPGHTHSLGYANSDLSPTNIALDSKDNPIILDFGSCKRFGEQLLSAGTYGWIDEDYSISAQLHDESAIKKIEVWLIEEKRKKLTMGY
jgi:serine/threonine protein kinase